MRNNWSGHSTPHKIKCSVGQWWLSVCTSFSLDAEILTVFLIWLRKPSQFFWAVTVKKSPWPSLLQFILFPTHGINSSTHPLNHNWALLLLSNILVHIMLGLMATRDPGSKASPDNGFASTLILLPRLQNMRDKCLLLMSFPVYSTRYTSPHRLLLKPPTARDSLRMKVGTQSENRQPVAELRVKTL